MNSLASSTVVAGGPGSVGPTGPTGPTGATGASGAAAAPTALPAIMTSTGTASARSFQRYNATGGAFTINLPTVVGLAPDDAITFAEVGGSVLAVTLDPSGGETIQGATTQQLNEAYQTVTLVPDGVSAWIPCPRFN